MWDPNRVRSSVLVWLLSPHYFTCINTVTLIALTSTTPKQSEPWKKKKMRWKKQADGKKRTKRKNKSWVMSHDSWLQPRWNITFYNKNLEEKIRCLKSISGVCRIVFIWRKKTTMEQRVDWMVMSCEARKSKNFLTFAPLQDVSGPGLQFAAHTVENHIMFWRNAS